MLTKLHAGGSHPGHPSPQSQYVGGSMHCIAQRPDSLFAVAFEIPGGSADPKTIALAAVAQTLLEAGRAPLPYTRREGVEVDFKIQPLSYMYK